MEAQQGTRGGDLAAGTTRGSCRGASGRAGLSGRPGGHDLGRQGGAGPCRRVPEGRPGCQVQANFLTWSWEAHVGAWHTLPFLEDPSTLGRR